MQDGGFFYQAFIYLSAAIVAVPIAKKLGLGSVLGYLLAGVLVGPFIFGFVGNEGKDVMHFAEFGVVMMLFLVGLELQPSLLWKLRIPIVGLGGLQVGLTTLLITSITLMVSDLPWRSALAIGLTLALSSTAIVIQTLNEKGLLKSVGGQNSFSVLLFQDIAVIPILAFLPMLAVSTVQTGGGHNTHLWIDGFSGYIQAVIILGIVVSIIVAGRYLISPIFKQIAKTAIRELFTAGALLLIISISLLMTGIGLSPALGAFLAGVVLAQSEYRHQLETDIEPFKGLLLGLFFIAVGASINFHLIAQEPFLIAGIVLGLILVKLVVLASVGKAFGMKRDNNLLFAFGLAQGGEFAFVLFSFSTQHGVLEQGTTAPLIASVAISMALTPLLMLLNEKVIQPLYNNKEPNPQEHEAIETECPVIIAGFGRFGSTIGRFLQGHGIHATYLDFDPDNVALLRKLGLKVYYGDASHHDLLHAAGAADARMLIIAVHNTDKALEIAEVAKKHYPQLTIILRAQSVHDIYNCIDAGITNVIRDHLESALRMGVEALTIMGFRKYTAERSAYNFRKRDEAMVRELYEHRHKKDKLIRSTKVQIEELEQQMIEDIKSVGLDSNIGWDKTSRSEELEPIVRKLKEGKG